MQPNLHRLETSSFYGLGDMVIPYPITALTFWTYICTGIVSGLPKIKVYIVHSAIPEYFYVPRLHPLFSPCFLIVYHVLLTGKFLLLLLVYNFVCVSEHCVAYQGQTVRMALIKTSVLE